MQYTGLFISPSGISELDCTTTKTDMTERSISIGRESLQVSVLPYRCSICAPLVTQQMSIKPNACRRNLITGLTSAVSPRVHILSTCKVGQKLGEILYLLICAFLPCLSWLLRSRVQKSRRDLWITLYIAHVLLYSCPCLRMNLTFFNVFFVCIWLGSLYKRVKFKQNYYIHFEEDISFPLKFHVQCSWILGHKAQFHGTPHSTQRWNISWWLNCMHVIGCGGKGQCTHTRITG